MRSLRTMWFFSLYKFLFRHFEDCFISWGYINFVRILSVSFSLFFLYLGLLIRGQSFRSFFFLSTVFCSHLLEGLYIHIYIHSFKNVYWALTLCQALWYLQNIQWSILYNMASNLMKFNFYWTVFTWIFYASFLILSIYLTASYTILGVSFSSKF